MPSRGLSTDHPQLVMGFLQAEHKDRIGTQLAKNKNKNYKQSRHCLINSCKLNLQKSDHLWLASLDKIFVPSSNFALEQSSYGLSHHCTHLRFPFAEKNNWPMAPNGCYLQRSARKFYNGSDDDTVLIIFFILNYVPIFGIHG